jgi:rhodanese-related sulfurtransferase
MLVRLPLLFLGLLLSAGAADIPKHTPAEAAKRVAAGLAVLIDVREPMEWAQTGVATPALLLPKSEFDDGRLGDWKRVLAEAGDKELIFYCRSGFRSGEIAKALAAEGRKVANAGGFKDWQAAGLPVRPVTTK